MQTLKLTKKYEKYPEYKDSGAEWLGKIPKDWDVKMVKHVAEIIPSNIDKLTKEGETTVRLCNYTDVYNNEKIGSKIVTSLMVASASERQIQKLTLQKDDVIITKDSETPDDIGIPAFVSENLPGVVCGYHLAIIRPKYVNGRYLDSFFRTQSAKTQFFISANGLTRYALGIGDIGGTTMPVPPEDIQIKIAKYLNEKTSSIDQIIEKKEKQVELLKEEIISIAQNEQMNGKGKAIRMRDLFKLAEEPIELEDYSEYIALGLYNRGRGLFHKDPQLGKDIKESDFYKVMPRDLIISGQFAWEGAVALAGKSESKCVVSHRYYLLRDGVIKTEYLLALLMTKFGDHILNEASRGSAGRNRPLNIKILLKEKIRVPSKEVEMKIELLLMKMGLVRNNVKKSIELLEEYKSSLISNVVTGKIKV
jgi:type I restriction enzyme S subunit